MSFKKPFKIGIMVLLQFAGIIMLSEVRAQSEKNKLLDKASKNFSQSNETEALESYLEVLKFDKDNFEALWHISLLYARIGYRFESEQKMRTYYQRSLDYAEEVLNKYPEEGKAHFVYAVANGRISDISGSGERVEKSHVIKKHAEKAVDMMPDYAPAWHLLGLWHSKVANVGSAQKLAAGVFSKGLPKGATNQKAVEYIQKAMDLEPEQMLRFKLDLARHYQRSGEHKKAIAVLEEVITMDANNDIDKWNLQRASELLSDLK
ncbi:MAG: hypothetical protein RI564_05910 [Gracilimonas sp.]|nr:hypothetical protein [Gracilimonas sp.]